MRRKAVYLAITICLAAVVYAVWTGDAAADVIYLKNGNVIRGTVMDQNESTVKIKFGSAGEMTFSRDEIHAIQTNELDYKPLSTGGGTVGTVPDVTPQGEDTEPGPVETEPLTEADLAALTENLARLKSDDPGKWMEAENALAKMGPKVFGRLESELGTAQKPSEAAVLMSTMSRIDRERSVAPIAAKAGDTNVMIRQSAVVMLGEIGDKRAGDTLVTCLADKKYYIRRDAAAALGMVADRRSIPALVRTSNDNDPEVKQASMTALNKITKMQFSTGKEWQEWWMSQSGSQTGQMLDIPISPPDAQ